MNEDKLKGIRQSLERRVRYLAKVKEVSEFDVWQKVYEISLRNMTLINDGKKR